MTYSYFAVADENGQPMSVHAHIDHPPENGVMITKEQAIEISTARRVEPMPKAEDISSQSDVSAILKAMVEQMAVMRAELDAIKKIEVVNTVSRVQE